MKTKDLIEEVISLPVDERAIVADTILRSLNPPNQDIDQMWLDVSKKRLIELREGKAAAMPGATVFKRIWGNSEK